MADDNFNRNFIDIGPECFASGDELVISYKGSNYYKACGKTVLSGGFGSSTCVNRLNHPSKQHEDFFGNFREEIAGAPPEEAPLVPKQGN